MDKDCAIILISSCMRAVREIGDVTGLADNSDDRDIYLAMATAVYDIMANIISPIKERFPDLSAEIENRLEKYDRAF